LLFCEDTKHGEEFQMLNLAQMFDRSTLTTALARVFTSQI
jgi:hypothetical protein